MRATVQAVRAASDSSTAANQLDELSHDVAASGEALAELVLGVAPEPAKA